MASKFLLLIFMGQVAVVMALFRQRSSTFVSTEGNKYRAWLNSEYGKESCSIFHGVSRPKNEYVGFVPNRSNHPRVLARGQVLSSDKYFIDRKHGKKRHVQSSNIDHYHLDQQSKTEINPIDPSSLVAWMKSSRSSMMDSSSDTTTMLEPSSKPTSSMAKSNDASTVESSVSRRQFVLASALLASQLPLPLPSNAIETADNNNNNGPLLSADTQNYQRSPINKRSGITLSEPERIYPISFITYLSRFLLVFDQECQQWWYTQADAIPAKSSKEEVNERRLKQFGQFSASVEVGLMDFEGDGGSGVRMLFDSLVRRYGGVGSIQSGSSVSTSSVAKAKEALRQSKSKEALRQIALLFSLLDEYQPVDLITQLLAAIDEAGIDKVFILDGGSYKRSSEFKEGNDETVSQLISVEFPDPPTLGTVFGGSTAKGKATMKESGRLFQIDLIQGGSGYTKPPLVEISSPRGNGEDTSIKIRAKAKAILGRKKGTIESIEIIDPGMGYSAKDTISINISSPDSAQGQPAVAKAVLEYQLVGIDVEDGGLGYAAEKPIKFEIDNPPGLMSAKPAVAVAYPKGISTSFASFNKMEDVFGIQGVSSSNVVSASSSYANTASSLVTGPTSNQLLYLLPSGFGLEYDSSLHRYALTTSSSSDNWEDFLSGTIEGKQFIHVSTQFGPRGRSPIERERTLDSSLILRFMASGAICSCVSHLILTPIDVAKTKVQTDPDTYNTGVIGTFQKIWNEEGAATFFDGWEPTFAGFFFVGAFGFFLTEFFRRYYTSLLMSVIMAQSSVTAVSAGSMVSTLEIPIIILGAATSAFFCCFLLAPFDAVRIRTVSQPDYADNIFGVTSRMVKEEGPLSLFSAVPVWFTKEIPYNIAKFLVFDTATEWMYDAFPAARENIRLSLCVSLLGGILGGIAASIVSNPADVIVSELKKAKTDMSPFEALELLLKRAGVAALFKGLTLRMIFFSLLVSLQFLLYDAVRISLGVGSDDMKLYLNVLGAALRDTSA